MEAYESKKKFEFLKIDKQQLLDILKVFVNLKYTENNFSDETQNFLSSLRYPSIDKQQFRDISINLDNFIFTQDILAPISSFFQFDISLLQQYEKSASGQNYIVSLAFIISWLCLKDFSFQSDILSSLFNLINQIPPVSDTLKIFLLTATFSHYIQISNSSIDFEFFLKIVSSLNPAFLPLFIAEFLTAEDDLTKQFMLSFISSVKNDSYFIQNLNPLIYALMPLIEKLDQYGLDFLAILTNFKDVQSIIEIVQRFPEIICNNIKSEVTFPPALSFNFPTDGYLDYIFNFDSTETLPNGLIPFPVKLFDDCEKIEKIATPNHLKISSILASFLSRLDIEFANLFLNSLAVSVADFKNNSLYMIFVLIVTKIKFTISKNIANALMNPVIFSSGISLFNKIQEASLLQPETASQNEDKEAASQDQSGEKETTNMEQNESKEAASQNQNNEKETTNQEQNDQKETTSQDQNNIKETTNQEQNDQKETTNMEQNKQKETTSQEQNENQANSETKVQTENQSNDASSANNSSISNEAQNQLSIGDQNEDETQKEITYDMIISIQKSIIDSFILYQKARIPLILEHFRDSPFLFAEVIKRVHEKLPKSDLQEIINEDTISLIMNHLSLLWYFCVHEKLNVYDSNNDKNKNDEASDSLDDKTSDLLKYRCARSTIFHFVFYILDDEKLCIRCFSSPTFTNGFLPRVLESSLQRLILSSLSKYLVLCNDKISMLPTFQMINSIFKVCQSNKEKLVYDLLNIINEASILNHSEILFDSIITSVTSYLNRYPSSSFLTSTLRLFTQISQNSDSFQLNHLQIKQLSSAVRQIEDDDHHDETISALLGLIGLSHSVTTSSMFLIKKPSLITPTFSILRSKQKLEEVLTFFSNLCKHSTFNIFQCHRGELDFLIIEMMKNISKPFVFRGCEFDGLADLELMKNVGLPLIMNIVNIVCNNAVTTKLIRLISLNNELSIDILNSINSNFSSLAKLSTQIIPINSMDEPAICVRNINGSLINQHFTIQASLFVDNPYSIFLNQKYYLFQLSDDSSLTINFILNGESIICRITTETDIFTCTLFKDFPKCQWTTILIFFVRGQNNNCQFSLLTKDYFSNNFNIACPDFKSKMTLKIGFTESVNEDDLSEYKGFPCFIGRSSLYPIEFTKEMSFSAVVTETPIIEPPPLFSYPQTIKNSIACQLPVTENIKMRVKNILDVFTESQIFEFLPLFSPLDQMSDILLRVLLSIISTALSYSVSLQSKFTFFPVISNLLIESDPKRLTYSLYMRFFSILGNCTEPHIISEIIKHILLNFELWIRAEPSQLIRIVQHWGNSLYSVCDQVLNESISFESLISMIRMYFWFTPIETNLIRGVNERSSNLDINLCWQYIDRLLISSIKSRGQSSDIINAILSHCATCRDTQQIVHYFSILRASCTNRNSQQFINELLFIFTKIKDEETFIEALKTLYDFSDSNSIASNVYALLNVVQELEDNKFYFNEPPLNQISLHEKLIQILPEYPLIYPLIILFSLYSGNEAMITTSKSLGKYIPKSSFKAIIKDDFWMTYLLILAIKLDKSDSLSIVYFICSIIVEQYSIELLEKVLEMIDFFDSIGPLNLNEIRDEILKAVTDLNLTNSAKVKNELFIIGAKTLLLHYERCSPMLEEAYNASPFYHTEPEQVDDEDISISINVTPHCFESIDIINEDEQFTSSLLTAPPSSSSPIAAPSTTAASALACESSLLVTSTNSFELPKEQNQSRNLSRSFRRKKKIERNSLNILKNDSSMRKAQSYFELTEKNKFKIEQVKSPKDLSKVFTVDLSQIKRYNFGIHLSNNENYRFLLSNVCQMFTLTKNNGDTNDNSSAIPQHVLKCVWHYLNCISNSTKDNHQNLDEDLHLFYSNASITWSMKVKNFIKKGQKYFSSIISNSLFPVSKVGIAFKGINFINNFLTNSASFSNKIRLELERRFGDIIKLKEKRYYKHRFRFSSNFTQPKVSQFAKNSIFRLKESTKQKISDSLISSSTTVLFQCDCTVIKIINSRKTSFNLTKESIILEGIKVIPILSISYILRRRVLQRKTAIEFITNEGNDFLIDFSPNKSKKIIKKITGLVKFPDSCIIQRVGVSKFFTKVGDFTKKWMKREMSNFEYLILMNIFGGRSFRDPSNYPIFPWIISNYNDSSNSSFNVDDQSNYRDLYYPISAQNDERRNDLLQKFDIKRPISEENLIFFNAPSNPTIVSYWLIHEEPFTSLHLETEGGKFDLSARLFSSISSSAEQAKSNSSCWELTPEFYYMPEFLLNLNNTGFESNDTKNDDDIISPSSSIEYERIHDIFDHKNNVVLPNWCHQSPFELVYLLRKALESEIVSSTLNEWIDMTFGIATSGESAKEHFNVFSPILLSDIWKIHDYKTCSDEKKEFIETCLSKSGQIPKPLFKSKHPKRCTLQRSGLEYSQEYESIEKAKQNTEILSLFVRNEEDENKTVLDKEKNLIKTATILFDNSKQIKVVYILGNGKVETYTIAVSVLNSVAILSSPSESISPSSSSEDVYITNDDSSTENVAVTPTASANNNNSSSGNIPLDQTIDNSNSNNNNNNNNNNSGGSLSTNANLNLQEKREFIVTKDTNERFLSDIDAKTKFYSLENGIIALNKDRLRFITANSISCSSDSNINYSSISPLFESDLLVCDSCDSISIVNNEGVILVASLIQSNSSSSSSSSMFSSTAAATTALSNSFISSSFLSFVSTSSPNFEENTSSEVLTLASLSTNSNPHSKINLFSKSGRKQNEYELEFKQIGRAHCEKPLVISSSKSFDILAVTSIEGNVNLYSLLNGIYECTCYTCDEPAEKILITNGWGFIIAAAIQDVYLFNVNGFLIRKVAKTYNIVKWCTWTDEKGFDFVAVIKDDGSVVVSEAFYLNFSEPIQIIREPPIVMKYYQETNSILIVTKNKKLYCIPVPSK